MKRFFLTTALLLVAGCISGVAYTPSVTGVQRSGFHAPGPPAAPLIPYNALVDGKLLLARPQEPPVVFKALQAAVTRSDLRPYSVVLIRADVNTPDVEACLTKAPQVGHSHVYQTATDGQGGQQSLNQPMAAIMGHLKFDLSTWDFADLFIFSSSLNEGYPQPEQPTLDCLKPLGKIIPPLF
jgi:hypothetical protein